MHSLDVARVSCDLYLCAELKLVVVDASPSILLNFAAGCPEDLQVSFTGAGFVYS